MTVLLPEQAEALRQRQDVCLDLAVDVVDAGVQYHEVGAYLLGQDLNRLCGTATDERDAVQPFVTRVSDPDFPVPVSLVRTVADIDDVDGRPFAREITALARGFGADQPSSPSP